MAQQNINIGAADAGLGDDYFDAFTKTEANFTDLYGITDGLTSPVKQVVINALADFPTPSGGVISLDPVTQYVIGNDIDIGVNTLALQDGTAVTGIDSITVTLTYTGTGDMFTADDASARINNLKIVCASGRFISWNDTLSKVLRLIDLGITCDRMALFSGLNSSIRFTNVSPTTITTNGILFTGTFFAVQYQSSLANLTNGTLLDLGSATFASFRVSSVISNIPTGTTFLSGLTNSGNIVTGGTGSMLSTSVAGTGTRLNNITVDDALWQFLLNDDIADTRPDGLLSMQANATETVIAVSGTYVLIAGAWVTERTSQFTATAAGRLTYNGGKDATLPATLSVSVEPASGASKDISVQYAKNGVLVANSKRTSRTSSGTPSSITLPWQDVLSNGDFIEWFVTNDTDTVNILVSSAIIRVN